MVKSVEVWGFINLKMEKINKEKYLEGKIELSLGYFLT